MDNQKQPIHIGIRQRHSDKGLVSTLRINGLEIDCNDGSAAVRLQRLIWAGLQAETNAEMTHVDTDAAWPQTQEKQDA